MSEEKHFSWYPGHMAKAQRELQSHWLPLLDLVIELIDGRVPVTASSLKDSLKIYTKADLSNLESLRPEWTVLNLHQPHRWKHKVVSIIRERLEPVYSKLKRQGRKRKARVGVLGMPNVGKSTFLNALIPGKKKAKTGNLPGVTRQMQLVRVDKEFDLLDTPGICPVKVSMEGAYKLAACQILPEHLLEGIDVANSLAKMLKLGPLETSEEAQILLREFRQGKLARVSLDLLESGT